MHFGVVEPTFAKDGSQPPLLLKAGLRGPKDHPTVEVVPINAQMPPEANRGG